MNGSALGLALTQSKCNWEIAYSDVVDTFAIYQCVCVCVV